MKSGCPGRASTSNEYGALTGTKVWSKDLLGDLRSSPAIAADGSLLMGSDTGKFVKLNPTTGAIVKEVKFGGMVRSSPAIARDGTVVVGSDSKKVVALDPNTLLPKWTYEAGSEIGSKVENY